MKAFKKIISFLLCAALMMSLCSCGNNDYDGTGLPESVFISEEKNDDFRYEVYEDYTVITEYFGEDFRVNIPSRLGGKSVKGIGDNAIGKSVLAIEIVDIPKSVVYIAPSAFFGCTTTTIYTVAEGNPVYNSNDGVIYSKDGKCPFSGLKRGFSGYMNRAALQQNAYAIDIRKMKLRPELYPLYKEIVGVPYGNALAFGEQEYIEVSLKLCEAIREKGYRILWDPMGLPR